MQAMVVGVPGTGKTYFMVDYLKKHFSYDAFFREYTIARDVLIITNISGLKFYGSSCWDLESEYCIGKPHQGKPGKYTREEFFTVENMEKIREKLKVKNIILVLDEIQQDHLFPKMYSHKNVDFLWQYHRHIGMDIIFGTQDPALVSRPLLAQCEYLAHGTLRSKKIIGAMTYKFTDNKGNYMYNKTLRTDKQVFAAYQSASVEEVHKPKNALVHWALIGAMFFVVSGGLFKYALASLNSKAEDSRKKHSVKPASPVPPPLPPPAAAVPPAPVAPVASAPITTLPPVAVNPQDMPKVIGLVETGKTHRYLLTTGQIVDCKRQLNIGDIYIR